MRGFGRGDASGYSIRGGADVLWVIDGRVVEPPLTFRIGTHEVECVEVRRGQRAALEFRRSINSVRYSGVILVWTKGSTGRKPRQCLGP